MNDFGLSLPTPTLFDPAESSEGSLDPPGTAIIAAALATRVVRLNSV